MLLLEVEVVLRRQHHLAGAMGVQPRRDGLDHLSGGQVELRDILGREKQELEAGHG